MSQDESKIVRVVFELEPGELHDHTTEMMIAESIGPDRYRLKATPLYTYGYSRDDIVEATLDDGAVRTVRRLVKSSGHSTFRFIITDRGWANDAFLEPLQKLLDMGCQVFEVNESYRALDVPPDADFDQVYSALEHGESSGMWYFEEAHRGDVSR